MQSQQAVHYALMCLKALDARGDRGGSAADLSRDQGVPMGDCRDVLGRLSDAGLIRITPDQRYRLEQPLEDLNALDVLRALGSPRRPAPKFAVMVAPELRGGIRTTRSLAAWAQSLNLELAG